MWFWHPPSWFWVLPFSLLFSFSVVITAGYVTQLASVGVVPFLYAYSRAGRHPGCCFYLMRKQGWSVHSNRRTNKCCKPLLLFPFFPSQVLGFCWLFPSGKPCTWPLFFPSGLPSAAWKIVARIIVLVSCKHCITVVKSQQPAAPFQSVWYNLPLEARLPQVNFL